MCAVVTRPENKSDTAEQGPLVVRIMLVVFWPLPKPTEESSMITNSLSLHALRRWWVNFHNVMFTQNVST